jgi:hypothetical protein
MKNGPILIASSAADYATWQPIADDLAHKGYEVVAYEADKVARGDTPLAVEINELTGLEISYDGQRIDFSNFAAAWFRRSTFLSNTAEDPVSQMSIDIERKAIQAAMWDMVPENAWLNSPSNIQQAERKLSQLVIAQELGMNVPRTVATNQWESIKQQLPEEVIYKSSYPLLYDSEGYKSLYTTPFTACDGLPTNHDPFPGIWQPFVKKAREWRITVVGEQAFDAAIYTSPEAKDDWRKHQSSPSQVNFRKESFNEAIKDQCFTYLGRLGLRFGAFDFIEDEEGEITFLECNPNGQFKWLEARLGLPISAAITDELIKIARAREG